MIVGDDEFAPHLPALPFPQYVLSPRCEDKYISEFTRAKHIVAVTFCRAWARCDRTGAGLRMRARVAPCGSRGIGGVRWCRGTLALGGRGRRLRCGVLGAIQGTWVLLRGAGLHGGGLRCDQLMWGESVDRQGGGRT